MREFSVSTPESPPAGILLCRSRSGTSCCRGVRGVHIRSLTRAVRPCDRTRDPEDRQWSVRGSGRNHWVSAGRGCRRRRAPGDLAVSEHRRRMMELVVVLWECPQMMEMSWVFVAVSSSVS